MALNEVALGTVSPSAAATIALASGCSLSASQASPSLERRPAARRPLRRSPRPERPTPWACPSSPLPAPRPVPPQPLGSALNRQPGRSVGYLSTLQSDPCGPSRTPVMTPSPWATRTCRSTRVVAPAPSPTKAPTLSRRVERPRSRSSYRCIPGMDGPHDMTLHVPVLHTDGTTDTLDLAVTGNFHS